MAGENTVLDTANAPTLKLVAICENPGDTSFSQARKISGSYPPINYFKSAQWSADGTCVITNSADNHIRTFIIPPDLLEDRAQPLTLEAYSSISGNGPRDAVTPYTRFDLQDPSTALILSAAGDLPIGLHSALTSQSVASYPLVNATTEAYIKPHSLVFNHDSTSFFAGSHNLISTFDLSRPGQEPLVSLSTGPKNRNNTRSNPGSSLRGIISALALDKQYNALAAGTLSRTVGIYDANGSGECISVFSIHGTEADSEIGGQGITQLLWSPCGRYLYIAERRSNGIVIYDIRQTGQLVGWLEGRCADTNQRMSVELAMTPDTDGHQIWAGGTDGSVRTWTNPHQREGRVGCDSKRNVHRDVVNSAALHESGSVLATASGQRHFSPTSQLGTDIPSPNGEASMKLWSLKC